MEGSFSLEKDLFKKWKKEKKVQTTFDSNGFRVFLDGKLNPNKEAQQFIIDMLQIYMTDYYGEFYKKKKKTIFQAYLISLCLLSPCWISFSRLDKLEKLVFEFGFSISYTSSV